MGASPSVKTLTMYGVKLSQNYSKKYLQKRTEKQNKVIKK